MDWALDKTGLENKITERKTLGRKVDFIFFFAAAATINQRVQLIGTLNFNFSAASIGLGRIKCNFFLPFFLCPFPPCGMTRVAAPGREVAGRQNKKDGNFSGDTVLPRLIQT